MVPSQNKKKAMTDASEFLPSYNGTLSLVVCDNRSACVCNGFMVSLILWIPHLLRRYNYNRLLFLCSTSVLIHLNWCYISVTFLLLIHMGMLTIFFLLVKFLHHVFHTARRSIWLWFIDRLEYGKVKGFGID